MPQKTKNKVKDMPETNPGSMPTTIRIENDILGFIRKDAKANHRTIPQEINYLIKKGIEAEEVDHQIYEQIKAGKSQIDPEIIKLCAGE